MMQVLCVLQARMSSTRLPGKVMMPVLGMPMIGRQLERIAQASQIDRVVVATSISSEDDAIAEYCEQVPTDCFRGNLADVLDRFYQAAQNYPSQHVLRLTADCPLIDSDVIDQIIRHHIEGHFSYTSNTVERSYPDGLDAEVFQSSLLTRAWAEARDPAEREHVTPWMHQAKTEGGSGVILDTVNRSNWRWTVDYPEDIDFVRAVFDALYPHDPKFRMKHIIELLDRRPELSQINARHA